MNLVSDIETFEYLAYNPPPTSSVVFPVIKQPIIDGDASYKNIPPPPPSSPELFVIIKSLIIGLDPLQ